MGLLRNGAGNMARQLLMGNEAIGLGAIMAGVGFVSGYPGTPATEVLETVAKINPGGIYVEWSVNEKVAMELAAGAAYAGTRTLCVMKQVGLNVAADPLMSLNYVGIEGGLVIVVADDPGPISSQTEQDTRRFGEFAHMAVFDPSTPEEAFEMIQDAFAHSEKYGRPVLFRPTTRVCHSYASIEVGALPQKPKTVVGFEKSNRWVIFPRLAHANHLAMNDQLIAMANDFSHYERNMITGTGSRGIISGGVCYQYVREALQLIGADAKLMKVSSYPFPDALAAQFLDGLSEVLVVEELDPVIEQNLIRLCGAKGINVNIRGKLTKDISGAGEQTVESVELAVRKFLDLKLPNVDASELPPLPVRPPTLCAGCPHRASFYAVKAATKGKKAVYSGDIGCYTLGNAMPLNMVDTCLCMGAGITVAQGLHRIEPDALNFAFIGDSTFFHSGITGVVNAVYNQTDIIVVVLDNSTTAMTGNQPHPGTGNTMMGAISEKISIAKILEAIGVSYIARANPLKLDHAIAAVREVMDMKGVRVILYEAPCIAVSRSKAKCAVDSDRCTGCGLCIKAVGCPAMSMENGLVVIQQAQCTGCGLCAQLCKFGAIGGVEL